MATAACAASVSVQAMTTEHLGMCDCGYSPVILAQQPHCHMSHVNYGSITRRLHCAYGPADANATPSSFAPVKSRMVYLFGASLSLTRVVLKKRPLNERSVTKVVLSSSE